MGEIISVIPPFPLNSPRDLPGLAGKDNSRTISSEQKTHFCSLGIKVLYTRISLIKYNNYCYVLDTELSFNRLFEL